MFDNAFTNTDKLLLLINNFIEFERIEAGNFDINSKSMELVEFIENAIQFNQSIAEEKGVKYYLKPHSIKIWLYADAERLLQVMSNILSDAVKHALKNSAINITVHKIDSGVRIVVTDQEYGVTKMHQKRKVQAISNIEQLTQNEVSSAILGISISKTIIEKHGGTLHYESASNKSIGIGSKEVRGVLYNIDLPLAETNSVASNM